MTGRRTKFTLRQIEVLVAVANHNSVTHAAEWLRVSQPAVTRTILEIETDMGATLFDRSPRGMTPTVFGESLVRHARAMLSELRHAVEEIEALKGNDRGTVRVGTTPIGASLLLPTAAAQLTKAYPGLRVEIAEENFVGLLSALRTGSLDLVLGPPTDDALDPALTYSHLFTDDLIIAASHTHPLGHMGKIPLSRLSKQRWVLPPRNNRLWLRLQSRFLADGLSMPGDSILSSSSAAVKAVMNQGDWLTVYPRMIVESDIADGRIVEIPIPGEPMQWDVVTYHRTTTAQSPATQAMQNALAVVAESLRQKRRKNSAPAN